MTSLAQHTPLLTIIIPARNDDYMKGFRYRIQTTLDYLAARLSEMGRLQDVEVLISDWGSPVPLHEEITLTEPAKALTSFLIVPEDIATERQADSAFPIVLAQNAAVRRARGTYVMQTDSDIIFPTDYLEKLFLILDGKRDGYLNAERALIGSKRRQMPYEIIEQAPPYELYTQIIEQYGNAFEPESDLNFGFCTTGMMMAHKDVWATLRGYDESLIHWGWMEIDLGFRAVKEFPWFCTSINFGMFLFHMEHYPKGRGEGQNPRKMNPQVRNEPIAVNGENWGLWDCDLEIVRPGARSAEPSRPTPSIMAPLSPLSLLE